MGDKFRSLHPTPRMSNIRGREKLKLAVAMTVTVCVALFVLSYKYDPTKADHLHGEKLAEQVSTSAAAHKYLRDPAGGLTHPSVHLEKSTPFSNNAEDGDMDTNNMATSTDSATAGLEKLADKAKKVEECKQAVDACKKTCDPKDKKCKHECKPKKKCSTVALEVELLQEEGY